MYICLRTDHRDLYTADLYVGEEKIDTLGGGYPRFFAARLDAWQK